MTPKKAFDQQVILTFDDGPHELVTPVVFCKSNMTTRLFLNAEGYVAVRYRPKAR